MAGKQNPDDARRQRAAARRLIVTLRRSALGDDADSLPIRGAAAISLVAQLTRVAWSLSGRPFPRYARSETPYVFAPHPANPA